MIAGNFKVSSNLDYNGRLLCINVLTLDGKWPVRYTLEFFFKNCFRSRLGIGKIN